MMKLFQFRLPKFRLPWRNPVGLKKLQARLFGGKKPSAKTVWKKIGRVALWGTGVFLLIVIFMFAWFAKDLPTPGKIRNLVSASSTRLFDRNMNPLYTISGEKKRITIEKEQIPDVVKNATVALEDKDFYKHFGLDFSGVARAVLFGGSRGGGSTITQQFIKNALLTSERTLIRKAKEAVMAVELEFLFSKEEILVMYLNEIPYGGNNYGVEAAARSFFNKSAAELTLPEAATLAALPQAPTTLSPYGPNTDRLVARRNLALERMAQQGYITAEQAKAAQETELKVVAKHESIAAPHFVLYVKDWLVQYFTDELGDAQLAEKKVEEGGLTVVTTLDITKQTIAEEEVAKAVPNLIRGGASNAGLVSLDPKRGEVIAMVGSVDYFQEQFGAYNIATASRQPGSSFKPIIYATAFKEKYNPATVLFDLKTDFGNYIPQNFDGAFRGPLTIRQAIGNSLNIPAVKTLGLVGLDKALKTAHDLGITTLTDKDRYGLSLALGGGEVRLIDMATAYGVFANGGILMPTTPVLKITDSGDKILYDHTDPKDGRLVLDPQIAYQISNILSDVDAKRPVFNFSLRFLTLANRVAATKTGTTNDFKDAWTIGYTPQLVTSVWAGNNDHTSMNRIGGSTAAAPIWDGYMERAHAEMPVETFVRPEGIQDLAVDRLSNKLPVDGSEVITDIFARWQVPTEKDDVHKRVRVCRENGLLADESIPDELAEERTFTYVHSEKPDNPNWENPVRAWAAQNGFDNKPPTEKCSASGNSPQVSITSPADNATVSGVFTISANASSPSGVSKVDFFLDNVLIVTDGDAPYGSTHDAGTLSNGTHKLSATVTSVNGATASTQINIKVEKDLTPPGNITNINQLLGFPGSGQISFTWNDPTDSDFDKVRIFVYKNSNNNLEQTIDVVKGVQARTISSLTSGTAYRFVFRSMDTSGNLSSGETRILTAP